ncbi:COG1361 family protein [Streptomyces niveiscabiei]|uniref:hypothetical protein n=1 Tax=Streptomyces niveiscabiei TaxID=164115 RepID=UPI0038F749AA
MRGLVVGAAAVLVGAVGVTGAGADTASPSPSVSPSVSGAPSASPSPSGSPSARAADPVDVRLSIGFPPGDILPGSRAYLRVNADIVSGAPRTLKAVIQVPVGMEYYSTLGDHDETKECANSADKRTVTCTSQYTPARKLSYRLQMLTQVKPPADLKVTATASTGDEPDANPADNTASATLQVRTGADFGVEWFPERTAVKVGEHVSARLVVTNHSGRTTRGPGGVEMSTLGIGFWPYQSPGLPCWADNEHWICEWEKAFAPGESRTFTFGWKFPKETAGKTMQAWAGILYDDPDDPDHGNDKDTVAIKVLKASGTPKPTPTVSESASASAPPPSASPSSDPSGGGGLASTGAGVGPGVLGAAVGLVVAGGGLFVLVQVRRRARS